MSVQKSINIVIAETKQELVSAINTKNLPITITELILKDILAEVALVKSEQLQTEVAKFNQAIAEEAKAPQREEKDKTSKNSKTSAP